SDPLNPSPCERSIELRPHGWSPSVTLSCTFDSDVPDSDHSDSIDSERGWQSTQFKTYWDDVDDVKNHLTCKPG
ncbi:MAG: hypothetical protein LBK28_00205, partial [Propionibacteriaceae bacterium]|nr:hypothetical protein [Propionibacteriaceae bacterium]